MNYTLLSQFLPFIFIYLIILLPYFIIHKRKEVWLYTCLYLYLCFMIYLTLLPLNINFFHLSIQSKQVNFIPFIDLQKHVHNAWLEIILNIIFFIPFGFLLAQRKKSSLWGNFCIGILTSLSLEILQVFLKYIRIGDITDIITNGTGTLIGIILYVFYKKK